MTFTTVQGKGNKVYQRAQNTFKPYAIFENHGGYIEKFIFLNGWGASVACHNESYGGSDGLY